MKNQFKQTTANQNQNNPLSADTQLKKERESLRGRGRESEKEREMQKEIQGQVQRRENRQSWRERWRKSDRWGERERYRIMGKERREKQRDVLGFQTMVGHKS